MKTLQNLFIDQLADMYDADQRIARALPKMAKAATCTDLQEVFRSHLKETEGHAEKLERVFDAFGHKPKAKKCEATVGLLEEGDELASDFKGSAAINAALISAAQKVEHYEMASYGCLREWASVLGNDESVALLDEILEEEKAADRALNELAVSENNQEAVGDPAAPKRSRSEEEAPEHPRGNGGMARRQNRGEVAVD